MSPPIFADVFFHAHDACSAHARHHAAHVSDDALRCGMRDDVDVVVACVCDFIYVC